MTRSFLRTTSAALLLATFATATFATSPARADDTDTGELEGLLNENVVSTASKTSEVGATAPATVTTVTGGASPSSHARS